MSEVRGTIEPLPSGRFRVRFRIGGPLKTPPVGTFVTEAEAEAYRAQMAVMLAGSKTPATTVATYGFKVIDSRELDGDTTDADNERSRWRTHVESDEIGAIAIGALETIDARDWLKRLKRKGLSRATCVHCLNLMRAVLHEAFDRELHRGPNPCVGIRLKKEKRTEEPWTFLLPAEQDELVACTPAPLDALVEASIGLGVRSGEFVALRLEDLHLEGDYPHLVVRYGGPPTAEHPAGVPTKSGKPREIPVLGRARRAIERWLAALPTYCGDNPHGLLFPGARGAFRSHDHVLRWEVWKGSPQKGQPGERHYHSATVGILARAGIKRDVRWHDLRHTCATSLLNGWWDRPWSIVEVCAMLGHASVKTTADRYAHVSDTILKKAARETVAAQARALVESLVVPPGAEAVFHTCSTADGATSNSSMISKSGTRVSNSRPSAWEADALPTELVPRRTPPC
jgi:integrase